MISVKASIKKGRHKLRISGHADYNPGNDIVCAGVSAIAFALLGWLANSPDSIIKTHLSSWESGDVRLDITGDVSVSTAFYMAVIGIMQIAQQYPENIVVSGKIFDSI